MHGCSVCSSMDVKPAFSNRGYDLARCATCTHLFVTTPIPPSELDAAYDAGYYGAGRSAAEMPTGYDDYVGSIERRMAGCLERVARIERMLGRRGRLLDFGCAIGVFVKAAVDAGWKARGCERSSWAAEYGRSRFGLDIVVTDGADDRFGSDAFDVVTMWDVLEHLERPREVLGRVRSWVARGGLLALNTVNSSSFAAHWAGQAWRHLHPPHHLQYYSARSLSRLLAESGFRQVWSRSEGDLFGDAAADSAKGAVRRGVEKAVGYWRLRPLVTVLGLLDEIEVIAVRT